MQDQKDVEVEGAGWFNLLVWVAMNKEPKYLNVFTPLLISKHIWVKLVQQLHGGMLQLVLFDVNRKF